MRRSILCGLLALAASATAHITLEGNSTSVPPLTVPTYNYLQASAANSNYGMTGTYFPIFFRIGTTKCQFNPRLVPSTRPSAQNGDGTVVATTDVELYESGCRTLAQVAEAAADLKPELARKGLPPLSLLIIHLVPEENVTDHRIRGGPYSELYTARRIGDPDGNPVVPIAFTPPEVYIDVFEQAIQGDIHSSRIKVVYEDGPWNVVFRSPGYYAIVYLLFTIHIFALLYVIYMTVCLVMVRLLRFERRNLIVLLAFISTLLSATSMMLPIATQASQTLQQFSTLLFNLAFYLLLYSWLQLLATMYPSHCILPQRILIILTGTLLVVCYIMQAVDGLTRLDDKARDIMLPALFLVTLVVQLLNVIMFAYFVGMFVATGIRHQANARTYRALLQLSYIGAAGFLAVILFLAANLVIFTTHRRTLPNMILIAEILRLFAFVIRSSALLCVFGVRLTGTTAGSSNNNTSKSGQQSTQTGRITLTPIHYLMRQFGRSRSGTTATAKLSTVQEESRPTMMTSTVIKSQP